MVEGRKQKEVDHAIPRSTRVALVASHLRSLILGAALAIAMLGFGIGAWILLAGAFCALMMGSMIWMMIAMGRHAKHRH